MKHCPLFVAPLFLTVPLYCFRAKLSLSGKTLSHSGKSMSLSADILSLSGNSLAFGQYSVAFGPDSVAFGQNFVAFWPDYVTFGQNEVCRQSDPLFCSFDFSQCSQNGSWAFGSQSIIPKCFHFGCPGCQDKHRGANSDEQNSRVGQYSPFWEKSEVLVCIFSLSEALPIYLIYHADVIFSSSRRQFLARMIASLT